jgi:sulfate-transporting ATPase
MLRTSRLGSAMLAVRANERSAAAAGINVVRIKLTGFAIGSFIAGLGGCLLAYKQTNVTFQAFNVFAGLGVFATAFLAGITSVAGGILAGLMAASGIAYVFLGRAVDISEWYGIVTSIGLILTVITYPDGLVGPIHAFVERRRQAHVIAKPPLREAVAAASAPIIVPAPAPPGVPLLSVRDLGVNYGGVVAVDDVSFDVDSGTVVGVIGPNGAGKTTLMDAICGFTSYTGELTLGGRSLDGRPPHARARLGLARTFQGVDLYEDLTVEENAMVGQYTAHRDALDLTALLDSLGLAELRERNVRELSQGHRQLVSIARALASRPRLLLLDEPAAGLDTTESARLADRLRAVRDLGVSIVLVDHDMGFVLGLCDTIHVLDFGKEIASGPPTDIRANVLVAEAYLGSTHADPVVTTS